MRARFVVEELVFCWVERVEDEPRQQLKKSKMNNALQRPTKTAFVRPSYEPAMPVAPPMVRTAPGMAPVCVQNAPAVPSSPPMAPGEPSLACVLLRLSRFPPRLVLSACPSPPLIFGIRNLVFL